MELLHPPIDSALQPSLWSSSVIWLVCMKYVIYINRVVIHPVTSHKYWWRQRPQWNSKFLCAPNHVLHFLKQNSSDLNVFDCGQSVQPCITWWFSLTSFFAKWRAGWEETLACEWKLCRGGHMELRPRVIIHGQIMENIPRWGEFFKKKKKKILHKGLNNLKLND